MKTRSSYRTLSFIAAGCLLLAGLASLSYYSGFAGRAAAAPQAASAPAAVTMVDAGQRAQYAQYLAVSEWGVRLGLADIVTDATYHIDGNTIWLSTANLDQDPACYAQGAASKTFASITRHNPSDSVRFSTAPTDPGTTMTAAQATEKNPFEFHTIGGLVYEYRLDSSNQQCPAETNAQVNAFTDAWLSLRPA